MPHVSIDESLDLVLSALADRVKSLRVQRDLSVAALSFEAGLSEARIRAVESGRATASLATLVALADTFEIDVAELFGGSTAPSVARASESTYVVPSEVVWGGELPPAPWRDVSPRAAEMSAYVVPSEVVWGGDLPAAPWTSAVAAPTMPELPPAAPHDRGVFTPTEKTWGGPLPPAPWLRGVETVSTIPAKPIAAVHRPHPAAAAAVDAARPRSAPHADTGRSPDPVPVHTGRHPRTFTDLRVGVLSGREFRSLREFAVAAVVEAGHPVYVVARIFRLPSWRLERWIDEKHAAPR